MNNSKFRILRNVPGSGASNTPLYPGQSQVEKSLVDVKEAARFGKLRYGSGNLIANEERKIINEADFNRQFLMIRCVTGSIAVNFDNGIAPNASVIVLPAGGYILFDSFVPQNEIYVVETVGAAASFAFAWSQVG